MAGTPVVPYGLQDDADASVSVNGHSNRSEGSEAGVRACGGLVRLWSIFRD